MNVHMLQLLLLAGANPNQPSVHSGMNAMHFAAARGIAPALHILLRHPSSDPCIRDNLNLTVAGHFFYAGGPEMHPQLMPLLRPYLPGGRKQCPGDDSIDALRSIAEASPPTRHMDLSKSVAWAEVLLDDPRVDGHSPPAKVHAIARRLLNAREKSSQRARSHSGHVISQSTDPRTTSFESRYPHA